ncbi:MULTISPECIES: hypothetical protein [unclassified Flavobacterium]|uniref:hypothetical protein n=1 Tax=unclassified Flavobacterium TaxID=196869 RepID=UPI00057E1F63|nr:MULTISPECIES: hypothetical protein [unclassified Flavobacterium]KIA99992.1 hypothetical protein OA93_04075 [Flavobacterium sp. KMS]OUL62266.1 hypothetical protein B8T70_10760 [Flavobacterium sp. AJR]
MKKLIFSALLAVAFSGPAMANTVESDVASTFFVSNCGGVYHRTYIEFCDIGLEDDASGEAWAAYKECLG